MGNVAGFADCSQCFHEYRAAWFALVAFHALKPFEDDIADRSERVYKFFEIYRFWHLRSSLMDLYTNLVLQSNQDKLHRCTESTYS